MALTELNDTFINKSELAQNVTEDLIIIYPLSLVIPITIIYILIFISGTLGNISTCIVITTNKSMHTATNFYLLSLAISDMLLLFSGLPPEMYRIWSPETYIFGEVFCILQGFAAETSANATVLTITAFTIERYVAICYPFFSHTISKLSRAIRYIIVIWIIALGLAIPQAIQFGLEYEQKNDYLITRCTVVSVYFEHAFEISSFVFFFGPMTLITILYIRIGIQLRKSIHTIEAEQNSLSLATRNKRRNSRNATSQNRVVRMLIAVVVAFFLCWAPFHAQRLLAVYLSNAPAEAQKTAITIYIVLMHSSGVLYFLSTSINPILYNIMSKKFREAFQKTFLSSCTSSQEEFMKMHYNTSLKQQAVQSCNKRHKSVEIVTEFTVDEKRNSILGSEFNKILPENPSDTLNNIEVTQGSYLRNFLSRLVNFFQKKYNFSNDNNFNKISNSSLENKDENEFSRYDLVKYMEEINEDIA